MSVTQNYKTITLPNVTIDLLVDALEVLAARLEREVEELKAADWPGSQAAAEEKLATVRKTIADLGAL